MKMCRLATLVTLSLTAIACGGGDSSADSTAGAATAGAGSQTSQLTPLDLSKDQLYCVGNEIEYDTIQMQGKTADLVTLHLDAKIVAWQKGEGGKLSNVESHDQRTYGTQKKGDSFWQGTIPQTNTIYYTLKPHERLDSIAVSVDVDANAFNSGGKPGVDKSITLTATDRHCALPKGGSDAWGFANIADLNGGAAPKGPDLGAIIDKAATADGFAAHGFSNVDTCQRGQTQINPTVKVEADLADRGVSARLVFVYQRPDNSYYIKWVDRSFSLDGYTYNVPVDGADLFLGAKLYEPTGETRTFTADAHSDGCQGANLGG